MRGCVATALVCGGQDFASLVQGTPSLASGDLGATSLAPTACGSFCGTLKGTGQMASAPLLHTIVSVLSVFSLKVPSRKSTPQGQATDSSAGWELDKVM